MARQRRKVNKRSFKLSLPKLSRPKRKRVKIRASAKPQKVIEKRKDEVKRRKNYVLSLVIIILLWLGTATYVYFVDPLTSGAIFVFFVLAFFTLFFTLAFVFIHTRIGLITALTLTVFLVLRYFGIGSVINLILLSGIAVTAEFYIRSRT